MTAILRVPRSRGATTGVLLVLLGVWGALIPFIGPYFNYAYTPSSAWAWSSGRLWLSVIPGVAAALGGLILLASGLRPAALVGAGLAAVAGAWFVIGPLLHALRPTAGELWPGVPAGGTAVLRFAEQIGFFTGLGVVIVFLAAVAMGRLTVIATRDARLAEAAARGGTAETGTGPQPETPTAPRTAPKTKIRSGTGTGTGTGDGPSEPATGRHRTLTS